MKNICHIRLKQEDGYSNSISSLTFTSFYEGGTFKNTKGHPINKLIPVGNMGGFRCNGKLDKLNFLVLYTDGSDLLKTDRHLTDIAF